MTYAFISYSRTNADYAYALAQKLIDEGFDVWIDQRIEHGEDWWTSIVEALKGCGVFIPIMTPKADASRWVEREVTIADNLEKPAFPLLLAGDIYESDNWTIYVRTQYLDVTDGSLPDESYFENLEDYIPRNKQSGGRRLQVVADDDASRLRAPVQPVSSQSQQQSSTAPPTQTAPRQQGSSRGLLTAVITLLIAGGIAAVVLLGSGQLSFPSASTSLEPTIPPATTIPEIAPTSVPPTAIPATPIPPTAVPDTPVPPTPIPPTPIPPTPVPTNTPSLTVDEDCLSFNTADVRRVEESASSYYLTSGRSRMLAFDNAAEANQALSIIQHYGLNDHCFVSRPNAPLEYWLVDDTSPSGAYAGEDCLRMNPDNLTLRDSNGRWIITDGNRSLFNFEDERDEARKAIRIIQYYDFRYTCFVGRPNASMQYLRR